MISTTQSRDSGLALVLIGLLLYLKFLKVKLILLSILFLLISMTTPLLFKPFAYLWFGFSEKMGKVVSKIMLTGVFFGVVTPIGFLIRSTKKNYFNLEQFKRGDSSVFVERSITFTQTSFDHPY